MCVCVPVFVTLSVTKLFLNISVFSDPPVGRAKLRVFFQIHQIQHISFSSCNFFNKSIKPFGKIMSFLFCTHFIGVSDNPGELGSRKEGRKLVSSTNVVPTGV